METYTFIRYYDDATVEIKITAKSLEWARFKLADLVGTAIARKFEQIC